MSTLYLSDLDGTLFTTKKNLSERTGISFHSPNVSRSARSLQLQLRVCLTDATTG